MTRKDIEETFADDYQPPWMDQDDEQPERKPRRRHGAMWDPALRCYVLEDCSLFYTGTGRPITPKIPVPELNITNRW